MTGPDPAPERRVDVLGVHVSAVDPEDVLDRITGWVEQRRREYVCVTGVHGVMESQRDASLREVHNRSGLTVPDGVPLVWCARRAGFPATQRVYGPDLMLAVLARAAERGWTSYLYGGADGVPEQLAARLAERFPGLQVVGTHSPPFRPLTAEESAEVDARIDASGADLVWVGLSTPKQERWMAEHRPHLHGPGAAGRGCCVRLPHRAGPAGTGLDAEPGPGVALPAARRAATAVAALPVEQPPLRRGRAAAPAATGQRRGRLSSEPHRAVSRSATAVVE